MSTACSAVGNRKSIIAPDPFAQMDRSSLHFAQFFRKGHRRFSLVASIRSVASGRQKTKPAFSTAARAFVPKFFFHIHDGQNWPDSKGIESCDWRSALVLAVRKAGERLITHAEQIALSDEWWLDVTNSDGLVLYRVNLVIDEDPHSAPSS